MPSPAPQPPPPQPPAPLPAQPEASLSLYGYKPPQQALNAVLSQQHDAVSSPSSR